MTSNATSAEWKAGNVAMMNMWGSRMGPLMDPEQSTPTVVKTTTLGDPMTVGGGSTPATTLWWTVGLLLKTFQMQRLKLRL